MTQHNENPSFDIDTAQLPNAWTAVPVRELAKIIRGVSYKKDEVSETARPGYVPILRATNIQENGLVLDNDLVYVPEKFVSAEQKLRPGDIVVATSSGSKHLVGKTAALRNAWTGSFGAFCAVLRPTDHVNSRYLAYFLDSPAYKKYISSKALGVNINNLRRGDLEEIVVPIAPPDQQLRIVAEIEKQFSHLDEAVANLKRVKANLKRYKAAVLKAAVEGKLTEEWRKQHPDVEPASELLKRILAERRAGWEQVELAKLQAKGKARKDDTSKKRYPEPAATDTNDLPKLPEGWVWAKTDQIFWFVTSGSRGWAEYYSEIGPLFLRIGNLDHDSISIDFDDLQRVSPPEGTEGTRTRVVPGDILVSITADVGMIAMVPGDIEEAYINQHISLARPVSSLNRTFLAWYLCSKKGQDQFKELQRGATKAGLGLNDIRAVNVPLPPLAEQDAIVQEIDRRFSLTEELEAQVDANLKRAERIRQSILQKAFLGQLVGRIAETTEFARAKEPKASMG